MWSCEKSADMKGKEGHKTTHCHRERGTEDTSGEEEEESRREGGRDERGGPARPEQESKEKYLIGIKCPDKSAWATQSHNQSHFSTCKKHEE